MNSAATTTPEQPRWRLGVFVAVQLVLLGGGLGWTAHRYRSIRAERTPPQPMTEPVTVRPQYNRPELISDEDLHAVLTKLRPMLRGRQPKINHVDHALRFWGVEAKFQDEKCLSGVELRELLLDHRRFAGAWGDEERPFLLPDTQGVAFRTMDGSASASHVDHTLASLGETGTPLDYPLITPDGERPLRDAFTYTLQTFDLNQIEYEWSTLAFALYMPRKESWYATSGELISFDRLADRIMRQRLSQGVCRGNHRLHTLVMLLRIDDQEDILSEESRADIIAHLQDVTRRFIKAQSEEGWFDYRWPGTEWDGTPSDSTSLEDIQDRLLVTGHVLEWWALAPPELHPPDEVLIKATKWLSQTILDLSPRDITRHYTFLTHAGRALCLWRGQFPAEFWNERL